MKFVAMGGGTGLSTLLKGLKKYVRPDRSSDGLVPSLEEFSGAEEPRINELSAIVTVSDDGGSSGRLRREFQVLPPGDIRNCLVALSEDEALLSRLFQFRFSGGRGLKGHSFGNLFLTALTGVTGDFQEAVKVSSEVLVIRGRIIPSTMADIQLEAVLENGRIVQGETQISRSRHPITRIRLVPPNCRPLPQTLEAIAQADVITLGPGSLFTSLLPNLLVRDVTRKIAQSRAAKIYICNLMTQPGETTGFSASDHLRTIYEHCRMALFDYVLLDTVPIAPRLQRRYRAQRSCPVKNDIEELEKLGVQVVLSEIVSEEGANHSAAKWVRHDPDLLARAVLEIAEKHQSLPASKRKT
ncbi:MAG: YvcK family protein [Acidobacteria bacterium]|nr:YvcK family protein [Acidobacteriota bacterium]